MDDKIIEKARMKVKSCIESHLNKDGYVGPSQAYESLQGAREVLGEVGYLIKNHSLIHAIELCLVVLDEVAKTDIDGSYAGDDGIVVHNTLEKLGIAINFIQENDKEKAFNILLEFTTINRYRNYWDDLHIMVLDEMTPLCKSKEDVVKIENILKSAHDKRLVTEIRNKLKNI